MTTILQLLFPIFCIVCSDPGQEVCDQCALEIAPGKYHRSIAGLSVWCGALYGDGLSQIILLAKEQNNLAARNFLADLVVQSLVARIEQASDCVNQGILVPIPSSAKATRVRGYRHAYELAMLVARKISKEPRLKASMSAAWPTGSPTTPARTEPPSSPLPIARRASASTET